MQRITPPHGHLRLLEQPSGCPLEAMPAYRCRHIAKIAVDQYQYTERGPDTDRDPCPPEDTKARLLVLGGMVNMRQKPLEATLGDIAGAVSAGAAVDTFAASFATSFFNSPPDKPAYVVVRLVRLFPGGKVRTVARADVRRKTPEQLQQYLASLFGLNADQVRVAAVERAAGAYFSEDLTLETNVQLMVDATERIDVYRNFGQ